MISALTLPGHRGPLTTIRKHMQVSGLSLSIDLDKTLFFSQKVLIFLYVSMKTYVIGTHKKCLTKVLLMSTHNMRFHGEIREIFV